MIQEKSLQLSCQDSENVSCYLLQGDNSKYFFRDSKWCYATFTPDIGDNIVKLSMENYLIFCQKVIQYSSQIKISNAIRTFMKLFT